jgi:translocator protein
MKNKQIVVRWVTLLIVVINIFFNNIYRYFNITTTIEQVTNQYDSLFVPAGYAFSIWGLIHLSFIIYCIYQLQSAQYHKVILDRLSVPLLWVNLLGCLWVLAYTSNFITIAMLIMTCILVLAFIMFMNAHKEVSIHHHSYWLMVPFSLFFGWISVATIAHASIWFISLGWRGEPLSEMMWTIIMICFAFLAGMSVLSRTRDWIYPLVIVWASIGIWYINRYRAETIADTAFLTGLILFAGAAFVCFKSLSIGKKEKEIRAPY